MCSPRDVEFTSGASQGTAESRTASTWRWLELRFSSTTDGVSGQSEALGAPVSVNTSAISTLEIGSGLPLPGLQYVTPGGPWKASLRFVWGFSRTWTTATMRDAGGHVSLGSITQNDGYLRADLSLCARLGNGISSFRHSNSTVVWGCVTAQPYIYARDYLSGGSLGVRLEL